MPLLPDDMCAVLHTVQLRRNLRQQRILMPRREKY
jgi:hypothetical protein